MFLVGLLAEGWVGGEEGGFSFQVIAAPLGVKLLSPLWPMESRVLAWGG